MKNTFVKEFSVKASSIKYGEKDVTITLTFDNNSNTSTLTVGGGFVFGGQTRGCMSNGVATANSEIRRNELKVYSLKALTKFGTNHLFVYLDGETEFNKKTRFIVDMSFFAITIKSEIYQWRKSNDAK